MMIDMYKIRYKPSTVISNEHVFVFPLSSEASYTTVNVPTKNVSPGLTSGCSTDGVCLELSANCGTSQFTATPTDISTTETTISSGQSL